MTNFTTVGDLKYESMKQCVTAWGEVMDLLFSHNPDFVMPMGIEKTSGLDCVIKEIRRLQALDK